MKNFIIKYKIILKFFLNTLITIVILVTMGSILIAITLVIPIRYFVLSFLNDAPHVIL